MQSSKGRLSCEREQRKFSGLAGENTDETWLETKNMKTEEEKKHPSKVKIKKKRKNTLKLVLNYIFLYVPDKLYCKKTNVMMLQRIKGTTQPFSSVKVKEL